MRRSAGRDVDDARTRSRAPVSTLLAAATRCVRAWRGRHGVFRPRGWRRCAGVSGCDARAAARAVVEASHVRVVAGGRHRRVRNVPAASAGRGGRESHPRGGDESRPAAGRRGCEADADVAVDGMPTTQVERGRSELDQRQAWTRRARARRRRAQESKGEGRGGGGCSQRGKERVGERPVDVLEERSLRRRRRRQTGHGERRSWNHDPPRARERFRKQRDALRHAWRAPAASLVAATRRRILAGLASQDQAAHAARSLRSPRMRHRPDGWIGTHRRAMRSQPTRGTRTELRARVRPSQRGEGDPRCLVR
mmetsp:Transcript_4227/g.26863  ORF Transcript_4227/g.26863 Transcript_4227/m.26863 type:complete len:309 (-) Transcript_4227:3330-4256(-)